MVNAVTVLSLLVSWSLTTAQNHGEPFVARWAISGGGSPWRSLFASMGFANLFQQAGMLDDDHSHFTAISSSSSSWWSIQAFFSSAFYDATTMAATPDDVKEVALDWMRAYLEMVNNTMTTTEQHDICTTIQNELKGTTLEQNEDDVNINEWTFQFKEHCNLLMDYDGDWAAFVQALIGATAVEGDLPTRLVDPDNRVFPLQQTDLIVQSTLLPNALVRTDQPDEFLYYQLGHPNSNGTYITYTVPLSAAYTVGSESSGFVYNTEGASPLQVCQSPEPSLEDMLSTAMDDGFAYYNLDLDQSCTPSGDFQTPFGGTPPTVVQLAAMSSAAAGHFSPLALTANLYTLMKMHSGNNDAMIRQGMSGLQQNSALLERLAVCSQWPNECQELDGLFMDGEFVDYATIASNIAHYHNSEKADLDMELKIVVTNNNNIFSGDVQFDRIIQYFANRQNEGIAPGELVWYNSFPFPIRSPQVFREKMDPDTLNSLLEYVGGGFSAGIIHATTIENPAYGIRQGQQVELLLININAAIPNNVFGKDMIEQMIDPVGELVHDIASNEELLQRVKTFFESHRDKPGKGIPDEGMEPESAAAATVLWKVSLLVLTISVALCM